MIRQTGGEANGDTSTRSRPRSRARVRASRDVMIPSWLPSSSTTRILGMRIRSLTRTVSSFLFILDSSLILRPERSVWRFGTRHWIQLRKQDPHKKSGALDRLPLPTTHVDPRLGMRAPHWGTRGASLGVGWEVRPPLGELARNLIGGPPLPQALSPG